MSTSRHIVFDDDITFRAYGAYGDSHGKTSEAASTGFTGATRQHELGWYLLGDRFYLPWLRRFICTDSLSPFGPGGFNRYGYCLGDPINRIDPSGHASWKWLGTLLGKMGGAIGKGVETVSQVTPTTALTGIATVADVVSVATGIGAVAAAALGEAPTAGILGWVAVGSGLAGLGTSTGRLAKARRDEGSGLGGPLIAVIPTPPGRSTVSFKATLDGAKKDMKIKIFHGRSAVLAEVPTRMRDDGIVRPDWSEHPNRAGGVNHVVDTSINSDDLRDYMENIRDSDTANPHNKALPVVVLTGAHGTPEGYNWSPWGKRMMKEKRFGFEDRTYKESMAYNSGRFDNLDTQFQVRDLSNMSKDAFVAAMNENAHIVHAYCFSAADHKVMKELQTPLVSVYSI